MGGVGVGCERTLVFIITMMVGSDYRIEDNKSHYDSASRHFLHIAGTSSSSFKLFLLLVDRNLLQDRVNVKGNKKKSILYC